MYYYKTVEARKRHDEARNEHLGKIARLYELLSDCDCFSDNWAIIMKEITLLERQLNIYDNEMGY